MENKGLDHKKEEALKYEPEIYFPIGFYNVNSIIPPEHDILYSTLSKVKTGTMRGNKTITYIHICHAIFTDYGLAINRPISFYSSSSKAILIYYPWHRITLKKKGLLTGFEIDSIFGENIIPPFFRLKKTDNSESKKEFKERKGRFIEKFWSLVTDKKSEMENFVYNLLMDKPELRKKKNFKNYLPGVGVISIKMYYRALKRVKRK